MLVAEAIKVRALEDIYTNPLNIISFLYIIDFNLSILFSLIIINKNSREGARYS
jgi:hypothetical protein